MALAHAVFIAVTCGSAVGVRRAQSQSDDGQTRELEVAAGRFSFAPDTIEIAQGERVRLTIRSLDVEHGFAIAALGIDETIPAGGDPVLVEFVADQAGEFPIHCSVFCGRGHVAMSGTLVVRSPESEFASGTAAGASGQQGDRDFTLTTLPTTQALPRFKRPHRPGVPLQPGPGRPDRLLLHERQDDSAVRPIRAPPSRSEPSQYRCACRRGWDQQLQGRVFTDRGSDRVVDGGRTRGAVWPTALGGQRQYRHAPSRDAGWTRVHRGQYLHPWTRQLTCLGSSDQ